MNSNGWTGAQIRLWLTIAGIGIGVVSFASGWGARRYAEGEDKQLLVQTAATLHDLVLLTTNQAMQISETRTGLAVVTQQISDTNRNVDRLAAAQAETDRQFRALMRGGPR